MRFADGRADLTFSYANKDYEAPTNGRYHFIVHYENIEVELQSKLL